MKKTSFFLNAAATAVFAFAMGTCFQSCAVEDNPSPEPQPEPEPAPLVVDGEDLQDAIDRAFANGDEVVKLPAGVKLTMNQPIEWGLDMIILGDTDAPAVITMAEGAKFVIGGSFDLENVVFDASATDAPFIEMKALPSPEEGTAGFVKLNEAGAYEVDIIQLNNVGVAGLKRQFFSMNQQKYLINQLMIRNSIIHVDGTNKKPVIDCSGSGSGLFANVEINMSTIFAIPAIEYNGGLFSTQSGSTASTVGAEELNFVITSSTLYNVPFGKTTCTLRENNKNYQYYKVNNNIIVNCGKKNEFLVGLAAGRVSNKANWTASGNVINWMTDEGTIDIGADEATKIGLETSPTIEGIANFANPALGDFSNGLGVGDPRWISIGDVPGAIPQLVREDANLIYVVDKIVEKAIRLDMKVEVK